MKLIKLVLLTIIVALSACWGMFLTLHVGKIASFNRNAPCFVSGYETIFCQRVEGEKDWIYTVVARRNGDEILIQYRVSKLRKIYL